MRKNQRLILLIEPDKILSQQVAEYLTQKGYEVQPVQSAQEAIVAADKRTPDIIIMELLLARHSGIEFLYEFRTYGEWQKVPVIVLSRVAQSDLNINQKAAEDLGISHILYKPQLKLSRLHDYVEDLVSKGTDA